MKIIKIKKHLVTVAPDDLPEKPSFKGVEPIFKSIEIADLENDPWLNQRKKVFTQFIAKGHLGYQLIDPQTNECTAYAWLALSGCKPGHLPSVPLGVCWFHYERVKDSYQGRGYHKLMLFKRIRVIREQFNNIKIYTDTSANNVAARIAQKKTGFEEAGIYHVTTIGTQRIPCFYWQWGRWNREEKHPPL